MPRRSAGRRLVVRRLGVVAFADAVRLQERLVADRQQDRIPDQLLLLEHPPVVTLGVGAHRDNLLVPPGELARRGIELHAARRGGDITYHGPGQLVGYPILLLKPDRCDVHRYVRDLEEAIIQATARFGVRAGRIGGLTGVWVGSDKLAAIGVRLSRWVTSHGFALNVTTRLEDFELIRACGLTDRGVTSLARLTGSEPGLDEVGDAVAASIAAVFDRATFDAGGAAAVSLPAPPAVPPVPAR